MHPNETGRGGAERRTGYVLVNPHQFLIELTEHALRRHLYVISGSACARDIRRGGFLRLRPAADPELTLDAVRAVVAALEAASWTVEPAPDTDEELRVRVYGEQSCPAMRSSRGGRWYCDRERGHLDDHQDDRVGDLVQYAGPGQACVWLLAQPSTADRTVAAR